MKIRNKWDLFEAFYGYRPDMRKGDDNQKYRELIEMIREVMRWE